MVLYDVIGREVIFLVFRPFYFVGVGLITREVN
jgi:hypothetical protein